MKQNKPVVGIIPTFNLTNEDNDPYLDRASFVNMYSEAIIKAGGIPLGIVSKDISLYISLCDAYLWPGGSKIWPEYYLLIEDALKNHKPFLGICLGAQALATYFNILEDKKKEPDLNLHEVYEKNKTKNPYLIKLEDNSNHFHLVTKDAESIQAAKHTIEIYPHTFLAKIYAQPTMDVVSLHSIVINRLPASLKVAATTKDGVIEAIEYNADNNKLLGVQYHPEIVNDTKIFEWLIMNTKPEYLILVNSQNAMPKVSPFTIVEYNPQTKVTNPNMEIRTCEAFQNLKQAAKEAGYMIDVESAYRSFAKQEEVMAEIIEKHGKDYALQYVAQPGYSEHQTGLAIDVWLNKNNEWLNEFDPKLNAFYEWLASHCYEFGFILRYPQNKENITNVAYEPWHIRYVGNVKIAKYIMDNNLTLEEYLERK